MPPAEPSQRCCGARARDTQPVGRPLPRGGACRGGQSEWPFQHSATTSLCPHGHIPPTASRPNSGAIGSPRAAHPAVGGGAHGWFFIAMSAGQSTEARGRCDAFSTEFALGRGGDDDGSDHGGDDGAAARGPAPLLGAARAVRGGTGQGNGWVPQDAACLRAGCHSAAATAVSTASRRDAGGADGLRRSSHANVRRGHARVHG